MKWAAMLRGINLGKRQLKKEQLIAAAEACGYSDARTLLASGNLVFEAGDAKPSDIERDLHAAIERLHGLKAQVFARNRADLDTVIAANPFADAARDHPNKLVVTFHAEDFPPALLGTLAERYDGPERLAAHGRELYIDFPDGQGNSALIPMLARLKFPTGTGRNWNTVEKLRAMLAE
jgi:uncharacterized protein (DUF1697 family)